MLRNTDQKEFFMEVYTQCNDHIREQPKFRDQVILFYTAVCAFFLSQIKNVSPLMFFCLTTAMIFLGLICSFSVINFRSWILQYIKAAEAVGKLLCSPQILESMDDITKFLELNCRPNTRSFFDKYFRIGHIIVWGFFFVTLAPFAVLMDRFQEHYIVILFLAGIYLVILFAVFFVKIDQAESMKTKTWIVRFYDIVPISTTPNPVP